MQSINNIIEFHETKKVCLLEITERYYYDFFTPNENLWIYLSLITGFQEVKVYTKKGTNLIALRKLSGFTTFPVVFDINRKRLSYTETGQVINNLNYDNSFNCHGFTFLNSKFWFLLDNQLVELLIKEDEYIPCTLDTLQEGGICLYYNFENQLIHSAKKKDGIVQSKFGIEKTITKGEQEIIDKYKGQQLDIRKNRYFNLN